MSRKIDVLYFGTELGDPFSVETKVIEEIPEPQLVIVTEYKIAHYTCPHCQKEVVATDPSCPKEGMFGNNMIAQAALLKYEDRLSHRKIRNAAVAAVWTLTSVPLRYLISLAVLPMRFNRNMTQFWNEFATLRFCMWMKLQCQRLCFAFGVHGKKHWIWAFTTPAETFVVIRKSRGTKVLIEVLTRRFKGMIVCDGWKPYAKFTNRIQRCWAHLLRESKDPSEKIAEAFPLHRALG